MKYATVCVALLCISTLVISQPGIPPAASTPGPGNIVSMKSRPAVVPQIETVARQPRALGATWTVIDSMSNILGYMKNEINPYAYDPDLDVVAIAHRAELPFWQWALLYYSVSTNGGMTWTKGDGLNAFDDTLGARFPSSAIFNPTNALSDGRIVSAYPNLTGDPPTFGDMGLAYAHLFGTPAQASHRYSHESDRSYEFGNQIWTSRSHVFCAGTVRGGATGTGPYRSISIVRSDTTSPFPSPMDISSTDTTRVEEKYTALGGDWIAVAGQSVTAFAFIGNFYRTYHPIPESAFTTGPTIGVISSTDEGMTWSELDTVNLRNLAVDLGPFIYIGQYDTLLSNVAGDMLLDSLGYPHCVVGVQTEPAGVRGSHVAIAEIYKTSSGWRGRIISPINHSTRYDYAGYVGYHPALARNREGTVFAVQYIDSDRPDNVPDLWVSSRRLASSAWSAPANVTSSPSRGEAYAHLAPRLRHDSGSQYTMFSTYAYWKDTTHYKNDEGCSPCRTYMYAGQIPVRTEPIAIPSSWQFYPPHGLTITPESSLCNMWARISGDDSLGLRLRIVDPAGAEIYNQEISLPPHHGDTTLVWPYCVPHDTGNYTVQFILRMESPFPGNDTLNNDVHVIIPGAITNAIVTKQHHSYEQVTPDLLFTYPSGNDDDRQESMALPFKMMYNGQIFDSIQFSTNGWIQFGKNGSPRNSTYGLAIPDYMGYNGNQAGFLPSGPLNSISPWWEDMRCDALSSFGIKTEGTAPLRTFIIQWKDFLAYYNAPTTDVRLNVQVRLYESTSIIEFHYGSVYGSNFSGPDTGAMISLKDETGGDYHFLDVFQHSSGQVGNGNSRLNPLRDWPGPDSMFQIFSSYTSISTHNRGWNIVSMPFLRTDYRVGSIIPGAIGGWTCDQHGCRFDTLLPPGRGMWLKFVPPISPTATLDGSLTAATVIPVVRGWNMIGSHGVAVPAPTDPIIVPGTCFTYNNGYMTASTISPGRGYWIKASSDGFIELTPGAGKTSSYGLSASYELKISDADGNTQSLYLGQKQYTSSGTDRYEMPPPPPEGIFDARFTSSTIVEFFDPAAAGEVFAIRIHSARYPVTVEFNGPTTGTLLNLTEDQSGTTHRITSGQRISITDPRVSGVQVSISSTGQPPKEYQLGQNYPNPFNPSTMTNYQLPMTNYVEIAVYDLLGRKIRTLVSTVREAGYYSVTWDGTSDEGPDVPSGIYFVRMTAGSFSKINRAVLIR